ncbi:MAG: glycosyltransferase family 4 protein [Candidatus Micrarchaeota archaeon]|nr:glycosyltransferase family 4 protein [Candidatus Micrarchaeota archaeon]
MRVAMLGWEFPPFVGGGLGVHCYELTKRLVKLGVEIDFYMPRPQRNPEDDEINLLRIDARGVSAMKSPLLGEDADIRLFDIPIEDEIGPYSRPGPPKNRRAAALKDEVVPLSGVKGELYGWNFLKHVEAYNSKCAAIVIANHARRKYDLIHNHDWITVPAAIRAKAGIGRPRVFTIHSTEYDRTTMPWDRLLAIEKAGFDDADRIIAVSKRTRSMVIQKYGADANRITPIYNGVDASKFSTRDPNSPTRTILFLGRLAEQKGPFQFLWAARQVLEKEPDAKFLVVGTGDLLAPMIRETFRLGIMGNMTFTGYIPDKDLHSVYSMCDVYVMPSLSEPFGITALEAMCSGTPAIVSVSSGVSEATAHNLKADFWDVELMAEQMVALLRYPALSRTLSRNEIIESRKFTWEKTARETLGVYRLVAPNAPLFKPRRRSQAKQNGSEAPSGAEAPPAQN